MSGHQQPEVAREHSYASLMSASLKSASVTRNAWLQHFSLARAAADMSSFLLQALISLQSTAYLLIVRALPMTTRCSWTQLQDLWPSCVLAQMAGTAPWELY